MKNKNDNELKKEQIPSLYHKIEYEWKIVAYGLFRPQVIIPLLFTFIVLYLANKSNIDRTFFLVLYIIATISLSIAISFFADAVKNIIGNNLLMNKGKSAVRNLDLVRLKTKNIFNREKADAPKEEIMTILYLLEKDIVNAIQEWMDILPSEVSEQVTIYTLLEEEENQLELKDGEIKQLREQLDKQKQLGEREKEENVSFIAVLEGKLRDKERERLKLSQQIGKLQFIGTTSSAVGRPFSGSSLFSALSNIKVCSNCGREYPSSVGPSSGSSLSSIFDSGLCPECRSVK